MIYFVSPKECLVQKTVDCLLNLPEFHEIKVIVPNQRLATFISLGLAARKKATWYPSFLSFEDYLKSKVNSKLREVDQVTAELILGGMLLEGNFKYLKPGQESEILVFFNMVLENGQEVFSRISKVLEDDVFRSEAGALRLNHIAKELSDCFQDFESRLAKENFALPLRVLKENLEGFLGSDLAMDRILVTGFTTIRPILTPLLKKLSASADFVLTEPFVLSSPLMPLLDIARSLGEPVVPKALELSKAIQLFECQDVASEIAWLLSRLKALLSGGVAPSSIGVVVPDEGHYGPLLFAALKAADIRVNYSLPLKLSRTPLGELLDSISRWEPHQSTILEIANLALHPLLKEDDSIDLALYSEVDLHVKPTQAKNSEFWVSHSAKLKSRFGFGEESKTLGAWLLFLKDLLVTLDAPRLESERDLKASMEMANLKILDSLSQCAKLVWNPFSPHEFWSFLSAKVLTGEVRSVGYPLKDVQVLSVKESRHIPFEHVFVLGMLEGVFPAGLPKDLLIEDWLKKKANLPGWQYVEAMEDTTFGLLSQKKMDLYLSWPAMKKGETTVPSRFVERLKAQYYRVQKVSQDRDSLFDLRREAERFELMGAEPVLGSVTYSPSKLEKLLECPWQHFLDRNGVKPWEILPSDEDFRGEGEWLHKVVEVFFKSKSADFDFALKQTASDFALELSRIADELSAHYKVGESTRVFMDLKGWTDFANLVSELYKDWRGGSREINLPTPSHLEFNGHSLALRGRLDALESFSFGHVIIDYKRGATPSERDVRRGIKPQLPLYGAALGVGPSLLAYWSFRSCKVSVVARSEGISSPWDVYNESKTKTATPEASLERFKSHLAWRLSESMITPDPGAHCERCPYHGSCRLKDPRAASLLKEGARWETYLRNLTL
jgi:RecB family exonuclease